nr:hypothetical protein [Burkholderia sp. BCC0322]
MAILEYITYPRFPEVLAPRELQACCPPLPYELEWIAGQRAASDLDWVCWCR